MAIHDKYTEAEVEFIKENYNNMEWDDIIEGLYKISGIKRRKQSIVSKASKIGLKRTNASFSSYTQEEDKLIIEAYNNATHSNLIDILNDLVKNKMPHRTVGSIQNRATRLGAVVRYPWTQEEDDYLIEHYYDMTVKEIANHFEHHNRNSVYNRIVKLGLHGAPTFAYTDEDIQFIKNNYLTMIDVEIGEVVHRAGQSIKEFRRKLGLQKPKPDDVFYGFGMYSHKHNNQWKKDSAKNCNYKCVISDELFDDIHHLYSRNLILKDTLKLHPNINKDTNFNDLEETEKEKFLNDFLDIQGKHPLGVCLKHEYHKAFHDKYGYGDNTPEQFYEFVKDIAPDKFDYIYSL